MDELKAPFPWFGGKSRVAGLVWERFGKVNNYVEPFFGSGAVLLGAPRIHSTETVNDLDGFICNFWRAIGKDPEKVASYADNPVNENDLHARHIWLVNYRDELVPRLEGDPDYYDAKIAGWWVWGICCWIGSGFCSGKGPWQVDELLDRSIASKGYVIREDTADAVRGPDVEYKSLHWIINRLNQVKPLMSSRSPRYSLLPRSAGGFRSITDRARIPRSSPPCFLVFESYYGEGRSRYVDRGVGFQ